MLKDKEYETISKLDSDNLDFIKAEAEKLLLSYNKSINETTNKSYTFIAFIITILGYSFNQMPKNESYYILFVGLIASLILLIKNVYIKSISMNGFSPKNLSTDDIHQTNHNSLSLMKIRIIDNYQTSIYESRNTVIEISKNFSLSFKIAITSFFVFSIFFFYSHIKSINFISYIASLEYDIYRFAYFFFGLFFGFFIFLIAHKRFNFF